MRARAVATAAVLALATASACMAGCGGGGSQEAADAQVTPDPGAARPLDLVLPDCSHSFRRASERLIPEMIAVALDSAADRRRLWAACFAGSPLRHLRWTVQIDFGRLPRTATRNPAMADRINQARALGLQSKFEKIIHTTPRKAPGSGQLEALELAAQTAGVDRVFMFTDARIFEPGGVVVGSLSRAGVEGTVDRWAPRLQGLGGVELVIVGGGLGAPSARAVRNARALFSRLAERVDAPLQWARSLSLEP
jgi:hypothetical protein